MLDLNVLKYSDTLDNANCIATGNSWWNPMQTLSTLLEANLCQNQWAIAFKSQSFFRSKFDNCQWSHTITKLNLRRQLKLNISTDLIDFWHAIFMIRTRKHVQRRSEMPIQIYDWKRNHTDELIIHWRKNGSENLINIGTKPLPNLTQMFLFEWKGIHSSALSEQILDINHGFNLEIRFSNYPQFSTRMTNQCAGDIMVCWLDTTIDNT